jgi:hypothetical protein
MTQTKNKSFITTVGIFGSLASIIALIIIFLPNSNTLELSVTTSLLEKLTNNELSDPDLKATYSYKGDTINNLWKAVVEFENKSNETFVISEKYRNILEDTLKFQFEKDFQLIDKKLIFQDFPNKTHILKNGSELGFTFKQWRPTEKIKFFFYIKTN